MSDPNFDLSRFECQARAETGAPLTLRHPKSGADLPAVIWLQGEDALSYRHLLRQQIDRQLRDRQLDLTAMDLENRLLERLAALTLRWEKIDYDGAEFPCTPDNARRLYTEQLWIREQVVSFVEDRAHFLP
ncbi:hypothetical protein NBZ79_12175 [Sneathiella marina]|uniref:Uncharacterized protein n=1 Tax=Sneathiella marina TaxID=2950108 RepID=A0ABY4W1G8_9PROT|nr:hypothetical protein [Sneathiella marina]USG59933.1 hypothetical protein NBZ79_12175 [Sneathiella marina]